MSQHYTPSDFTALAAAIAETRSALLLGDEDLTLDDLKRINDGEGFTFRREGGMGSTLVISEYHVDEADLPALLAKSDEYL